MKPKIKPRKIKFQREHVRLYLKKRKDHQDLYQLESFAFTFKNASKLCPINGTNNGIFRIKQVFQLLRELTFPQNDIGSLISHCEQRDYYYRDYILKFKNKITN